MADLDQAAMWNINRDGWDVVAPRFYGAAALPKYGPFAQTEDVLGLLGDIRDQAVLEIGCGSGHSLLYLAQHGARDLWGIDLSAKQIGFAQTLLQEHGASAQLFNAPMETNPGLPRPPISTSPFQSIRSVGQPTSTRRWHWCFRISNREDSTFLAGSIPSIAASIIRLEPTSSRNAIANRPSSSQSGIKFPSSCTSAR